MDGIYLGQLGHPVEDYNPKNLLGSIREYIEVETEKDPESAHERIGTISLLQIIFHIMGYQGYCGVDTSDLIESPMDSLHTRFAKEVRNRGAIARLFSVLREELVILGSRGDLVIYLNMGDKSRRGLLPLNIYEEPDPLNMMPFLYKIVTEKNLESIYISYNNLS